MVAKYEPLAEVIRLFEGLNAEGLRYCHWKSNVRLDKSLSAKTDLDLLVDPAHQASFVEVLRRLDIKRFLPPADRDYPGIEHWIGFDHCTGMLFHLHVHYRLVLGQHLLKNYHLPLEEHYFNSARMWMGVKVPQVELDLIVLCIRAILKYRDRDALRDLLKYGPPGLPEHITSEIHWLLGQTTEEQVAQALKTLGDSVPAAAILEFLQAIAGSPRDGWRLLKARKDIGRAVAGYLRYSRLKATFVYMWKGIRLRVFLKSGLPIGRMKPENGGRMLAFVGLDGAGKSTMLQKAFAWLSGRVRTRRCYLGNAEPSWLTLALGRLTRAANLAARIARRLTGERSLLARAAAGPGRGAGAARSCIRWPGPLPPVSPQPGGGRAGHGHALRPLPPGAHPLRRPHDRRPEDRLPGAGPSRPETGRAGRSLLPQDPSARQGARPAGDP